MNKIDVDDGQMESATNYEITSTLSLDKMIGFVDYLLKNDINHAEGDELRLVLLKRTLEEVKIEGTSRREILSGIYGGFKLSEAVLGNDKPIDNKDKPLVERLNRVIVHGKKLDVGEYYNTLASFTTYALLLHGI